MRVDVSPEGMGGGFEIGFGLDKEGRVEPQEIVLKMEAVKGGPNAEIGIGIGLQDGDWTKPEFNGKYKLGFSADGIDVGPVSLEEYGISVHTALSTDDFYDGEWQTKANTGWSAGSRMASRSWISMSAARQAWAMVRPMSGSRRRGACATAIPPASSTR